jgi:hypothetical protein
MRAAAPFENLPSRAPRPPAINSAKSKETLMVEVLNLTDGEAEPDGAAWVLIEKKADEYIITGRASGRTIDASFAPCGFDTAEAAIKASVAWADLLGIPVIYVRDGR